MAVFRWIRNKLVNIGRKSKAHRLKGASSGKAGKGRFKMGQESSSPFDESKPSKTLENRTLEGVAKYIRDGHAKRIVVMVCAHLSPILAHLEFLPLLHTHLCAFFVASDELYSGVHF